MTTALDWLKDQVRDILRRMLSLTSGRVTQVSPLMVDAGGESVVPASRLGWWQPAQGQSVWMLTALGKALALGGVNQTSLAMIGTITSVGGGVATITLEAGGSFTLPTSYAAAVSDKGIVAWSPYEWGKGVIVGKVTVSPGGQTPAPVDPGGVIDRPPVASQITVTIPCTEIRTWRNGGWRSDTTKAYQGDWSGTGANTACFFYGNGFAQLKGWTITKVERYDHRLAGGAGGGEEMRMRRHTGKTAGTSLPVISVDAITGPSLAVGAAAWTTIAALIPWVQIFADDGQGGIAAVDSTKPNYAAYSGLTGDGRDPMSGALRVTAVRS